MSTYLYLECLDHDPPLNSDGEVGQHLYDLPSIRDWVDQRDAFVALTRQDMPVSFDSHFASNAARFFGQHPKCRIGICDEYGRKHPIIDPGPE